MLYFRIIKWENKTPSELVFDIANIKYVKFL